WWEHRYMGSLARAAKKANQEFFHTGLRYAELSRAQAAARAADASGKASEVDGVTPPDVQKLDADQHEAEVRWRVARKNMHIAFRNYASAFYLMMDERIKRQANVS